MVHLAGYAGLERRFANNGELVELIFLGVDGKPAHISAAHPARPTVIVPTPAFYEDLALDLRRIVVQTGGKRILQLER